MKSTSQSDAFELPRLGIRLLELILPPAGAENELGDLEEEFYAKVLEEGSEHARRWFWRQTFMTVWVSIVEGGAGHLLLVKAVSSLQSRVRGLAVLLAGNWIPRRCAVGLISFPLVAFSLIALYTPGLQRIQVMEGQSAHPPNTSDVLSPNKFDTVTDGGVSRRSRADDQPTMIVETHPVKGIDSSGGRQSRQPPQITLTETEDVKAPDDLISSNPDLNHAADPGVSLYPTQIDGHQNSVAVPGDDRPIVDNPATIASEAQSVAGTNSSENHSQQPPPPSSTSVAQTTKPGDSPKLETDSSVAPEAASTPDDSPLSNFAVPRLSQVSRKILSAIEERLGAPYEFGTKQPYRSDSSDFVWSVFQQAGVKFEPGSARDLWSQFQSVDGPNRYEFGTLVFFNKMNHVGIVADENGFFHASKSSGVVYSRFDDYWTKRINGFRTVSPSTQASLGMFNLAAE